MHSPTNGLEVPWSFSSWGRKSARKAHHHDSPVQQLSELHPTQKRQWTRPYRRLTTMAEAPTTTTVDQKEQCDSSTKVKRLALLCIFASLLTLCGCDDIPHIVITTVIVLYLTITTKVVANNNNPTSSKARQTSSRPPVGGLRKCRLAT